MSEIRMRVLVTGSTGFLGRHLVASLRDTGIVCHGLARGSARLPAGWAGTPFTLIDLAWDLERGADYAAQVQQVSRLVLLVEKLAPLGLSRVIGTGSSEEYGRREGILAECDQPLEPLTPYGWSKRSAGEMLRSWSLRTGIPILWLRPFIVYGPGQAGNMLIPYALRQGLARQPAEFSAGTQRRDFLAVQDLVSLYRSALERDWKGTHVVNAGRGEPVAVGELIRYLADLLEVPSLFRLGARSRRPGEPDLQVASVQRARELFDWQARIGWQEGLQQLAQSARRTSKCTA